MKRVLVFGGREFMDAAFVIRKLNELDARLGPFGVIIHGCARGVDSAAAMWAQANIRLTQEFEVTGEEWQRLGKKAGNMRNARMLALGKPDIAIQFPGNTGTEDMLTRCKVTRGLVLIEVKG